MVRVYFERGYASEEVAMFHDEETYIACLPSLKKLATKQKWERVTENIEWLIIHTMIILTTIRN